MRIAYVFRARPADIRIVVEPVEPDGEVSASNVEQFVTSLFPTALPAAIARNTCRGSLSEDQFRVRPVYGGM